MELYKRDNCKVIGVDEAGRGCLAGPVVAASVILPEDYSHEYLRDSKKMTAKRREIVYQDIIEKAEDYSIGVVSVDDVDNSDILVATMKAMHKSLNSMCIDQNDLIIVDGNIFRTSKYTNYETIIKGDDKYMQIAAASVLAKVHRDNLMMNYHKYYPIYEWGSNKGYGNPKHIELIKEYGYTPLHRKSFNPIKTLLENGEINEYTGELSSLD